MCGEKKPILQASFVPQGSPPRVRGKAAKGIQVRPGGGITPACAGKRLIPLCRPDFQRGSPPRVRGKGIKTWVSAEPIRITPACAGKRQCFSCCFIKLGDHPRVCGEKSKRHRPRLLQLGSPPRVRGKGVCGEWFCPDCRITPACAGKSVGEVSVSVLILGSPPRVRGKGKRIHARGCRRGITPACAGKSAADVREGKTF